MAGQGRLSVPFAPNVMVIGVMTEGRSEERRREYSPAPLRTMPVAVILGYDS